MSIESAFQRCGKWITQSQFLNNHSSPSNYALDRIILLQIPWCPPDIKLMLVRTHKWHTIQEILYQHAQCYCRGIGSLWISFLHRMGGLHSCLLPGMVVPGSFTSYWNVVPILTSRTRYCIWLVQHLLVTYFRVENALCTTFICTATLLVGGVVCSGCENWQFPSHSLAGRHSWLHPPKVTLKLSRSF